MLSFPVEYHMRAQWVKNACPRPFKLLHFEMAAKFVKRFEVHYYSLLSLYVIEH